MVLDTLSTGGPGIHSVPVTDVTDADMHLADNHNGTATNGIIANEKTP